MRVRRQYACCMGECVGFVIWICGKRFRKGGKWLIIVIAVGLMLLRSGWGVLRWLLVYAWLVDDRLEWWV